MRRFTDRTQAADELAHELAGWRTFRPVVLGVPPGGVQMAVRIAEALGGEMDLVYVHKMLSAANPDVAMGAVDDTGRIEVNRLAQRYRVSPEELAAEASYQRDLLARLRRLCAVEPIPLTGRRVIIVDDGATTGATLRAAVHVARHAGAGVVAVAVPLLPDWVARALEEEADVVVGLGITELAPALEKVYERFLTPTEGDIARSVREHRSRLATRRRLDGLGRASWQD